MISVIIVDYKSMKQSIDYIDHLRDKVIFDKPIHFIIVDNTEDAEGKAQFCEHYKPTEEKIGKGIVFRAGDVAYCSNHENGGYARGNNYGAFVSRKLFKDDYYLFSNNDILLKSAINVKKLVEKCTGIIAAVGPKVVGLDGVRQSPCKKPSFYRMICQYIWPVSKFVAFDDTIYDDRSGYVYRLMGCFILADASKFDQVGGFDEHTFMYAEEAILSEKYGAKGYKMYCMNDVEIVHEQGGSTNKHTPSMQGIRWMFESNMYYFEKYRNIPKPLITVAKGIFEMYIIEKKFQQRIVEKR